MGPRTSRRNIEEEAHGRGELYIHVCVYVFMFERVCIYISPPPKGLESLVCSLKLQGLS